MIPDIDAADATEQDLENYTLLVPAEVEVDLGDLVRDYDKEADL